MISIKIFVFNPFHVNTYVLYDNTRECIIIDPGCSTHEEFYEVETFIRTNNLVPLAFYNTHCHIDHIVGNYFFNKKYKIPFGIHEAGLAFLKQAKVHWLTFGFNVEEVIQPSLFLKENDEIKFGNSVLKVIYTPGHANGSVCFYSEKDNFVIVGDVIFNQGIGRTDLPTGDYKLLISSIEDKIMTLDDSTIVYPGHGDATTVGNEKRFNPYLK